MIGSKGIILGTKLFGLEVFLIIALIVGLSGLFSILRKKVSRSYLEGQLNQLDKNVYHQISNVSFEDLDQKVDHLVLSIYGIFVIKRENYNGLIHGSENDDDWTVQTKKQITTLKNPIKTMETTTQAIAKELKVKEKSVYPIIAFSNSAQLEIDNKLIKGHRVSNYDEINQTIKSYTTPQLSKDKITELTTLLTDKA